MTITSVINIKHVFVLLSYIHDYVYEYHYYQDKCALAGGRGTRRPPQRARYSRARGKLRYEPAGGARGATFVFLSQAYIMLYYTIM